MIFLNQLLKPIFIHMTIYEFMFSDFVELLSNVGSILTLMWQSVCSHSNISITLNNSNKIGISIGDILGTEIIINTYQVSKKKSPNTKNSL